MEKQAVPEDFLDYFIIPVGDDNLSYALSVAQQLRSFHLTVDIELMRRNVGKSMKYANTKHAANAIIIGENERQQQAVTIRDMKSGDQTLVLLTDLYKRHNR
jgi:histidyl-tRNA synthetase